MAFYQKHVFFCTKQKSDNKKCCQAAHAAELCDYFKARLIDLDLHGPDKVRVSSAGCLGRCSAGPNIVIYPDNIWYKYKTAQDLDKIIEQHIINNKIVEELENGSA